MNRFTLSSSVAFRVVVLVAISACCGCASKPTAKDTVDSMGAFGQETAKAKDSVDAAVKALETLTGSEPAAINGNLDAYSKAVAALESQAQIVRANADKMKANGDLFFKDWEGSEDVSPQRRSELSNSYAKIKADMGQVKEDFTPFLASLKDIQSYMRLDPTVKGINSMGELVNKAKDNSAKVKSGLDAVLKDMNSVRGMLSTKSK